MTIEVMKQALEALETCMYPQQKQIQAITSLRQAIEQAEKQEPVAWMWRCKPYCDWPNWSVSLKRPADSGRDGHERTEGYEDIPLYTTPQPQQGEKSEPLDKVYICNSCGHAYQIQPPSQCDCLGDEKYTEGYIYTTPLNPMDSIKSSNTLDAQPQREWVGLTDEDLSVCDEDGVTLARYWEAKLKEKNT